MTQQPTTPAADIPDSEVVPTVRRVAFDWSSTPLHWIKPDDPFLTHLVDVLHLLLPAGERWFVHVYKQTVPLIRDDRLRAQVRGFMGQESTHAQAHTVVLDQMKRHGLDPDPFTRRIDFMFEKVLGDDSAPRMLQDRWLEGRIAAVAGIEHFTAILGQWILDARQWDAIADPMMLDLLRWHGAEEVEHRAVAFDTYQHVCGSRALRSLVMTTLVTPLFLRLWIEGARFLMENDPTLPPEARRKVRVMREWNRLAREGLVPSVASLLADVPRYLRKGYHPIHEGSTAQALAYLAASPGAQGAYRKPI